jgi:FkbM family methyltransferase
MELINDVELRDGWVWPKTDVSCWAFMQRYPVLPQTITELVPQQRVVIQAGGNCGFYPKQYAELFDTVYTFEPDWLNFYCLNLNVPNANVVKNQSCLGHCHQLVDLRIKEKNRGKNYVAGVGRYPTYCIDDLALAVCDLIHLDIEGYEYYALQGAARTIAACRPVIVIEMWNQLDNRFEENINAKTEEFLLGHNYTYLKTLHESDKVYIPNEILHNQTEK